MERDSFNKAVHIYRTIKVVENKKTELYGLRSKIVQILEGYTQIPEEEVFAVFNNLENLSKYLDEDIRNQYKQVDELDKEERELVKSALSIAEREGKETNWEAFKNRCKTILNKK